MRHPRIRASYASRVPCESELDRAVRRRAQRRAQCEWTAELHVANTRSCVGTCDGPIDGQYRSICRYDGPQYANSGFVTVNCKNGREGPPCRLPQRAIHPHLHQHAPSIQLFQMPRTFIAHPASHPKIRTHKNSVAFETAGCPGICSGW